MPRASRPLLLTAAALLAALPARAPAASGEDKPLMGSATGVTFSGYDTDALGRRRWSLAAESAEPLAGAKAERNAWTLKGVRIRTYEKKTGAQQALITAPLADYLGDAKTAKHTGEVTIEALGTRLAGRDWSWESKSGATTFSLRSQVSVRLAKGKDPKADPVYITSRTLDAVLDDSGLRLTFAGEVRVSRGDTIVTCDSLTTRAHAPAGGDKLNLGGRGKEDLERIDASGAVRLSRKGAVITGNSAEILPSKSVYLVRGDARFELLHEHRVRVDGESMRYDALAGRVTVEPRTDSADGRVQVELPAFNTFAEQDRAAAAARAHASGKRMEILLAKQTATLLLTGDVRLDDPVYKGSCERLAADTRIDRSGVAQGDLTAPGALRRIVAEGAVSLSRDSWTLRCGHAEFLPEKNRVNLSLSPRAEDIQSGASIEAADIRLDTREGEERLIASGSADGAQPVHIVLPPVALMAKERKDTAVDAGTVVVSRPPGKGEVVVFEFDHGVKITGRGLEGSCRRLGVEVEPVPTAAPRPVSANADDARRRHRPRRIVALGDARLKLDEYAVHTGRAEIIPYARLKELSVADDNGMDGREPLFVMLSRDEASSPGLRPKVTHPPVHIPTLGEQGLPGMPVRAADAPAAPMTLEADYQEFVKGAERLRAFATGAVAVRGADFECDAANAELLATRKAPAAGAAPGAEGSFEADTLVARGGVRVRFGERSARADTLEVFPARSRVALSGSPHIDGWADSPGVQRKTLEWTRASGPDGRSPTTTLRVRDEARAGMAEGVLRPKIYLPMEAAPDLGRALKKLDKDE